MNPGENPMGTITAVELKAKIKEKMDFPFEKRKR